MSTELAGARLWRRLSAGAAACPDPDARRCAATSFALGQKIFTPWEDEARLRPGDRPYAGWLYTRGEAAVSDSAVRRSVGVEIGVTGAPSGAAWVQTTLHRAFGFYRPSGWSGQIPFEPAGMVRYDELRRLRLHTALLQVTPGFGASLGTVRTELRAGARARIGYRLDPPWPTPGAAARRPFSVYLSGEVRGRAVARDLFLDGSTFGGGPRVEHRPLVGEWEAGLGVRVHRVVAEYRIATRGREYRSEPGGHQYATFDLALRR
jgi:lipid A 3-O-deacylase